MLNRNHKIYFTVIAIFVATLLNSFAYAETIRVECKKKASSEWTKYSNDDPKARYVLTTIGLDVPGKENSITNWYGYLIEKDMIPDAAIAKAKCQPLDNGEIDMLSMENQHDVANVSPLTCGKGESVYVSFEKPICQNGEYLYVADLTKEKKDFVVVEKEDCKNCNENGTFVQQEEYEVPVSDEVMVFVVNNGEYDTCFDWGNLLSWLPLCSRK